MNAFLLIVEVASILVLFGCTLATSRKNEDLRLKNKRLRQVLFDDGFSIDQIKRFEDGE